MRSDNNYAFRNASSCQNLNILQFFIEHFQLSEDDYNQPVNQYYTLLIKKACKEENRFMVSWFVTNNEILLNDIPKECKQLIEDVLNEHEIMIKPSSKIFTVNNKI